MSAASSNSSVSLNTDSDAAGGERRFVTKGLGVDVSVSGV